jgi:hypothetical protein
MKIILAIFTLMFGGLWYSHQEPVGKEDIYVNRLVYLKKDSSLFTGTLEIEDAPHKSIYPFCKGLPCGKWEYRFNGDLIHKGEYLEKYSLSNKAQKIIATDTFFIDYWQEGELPTTTYPPFLTVYILKEASFFQRDKKQYESYFSQLANAIMYDTRNFRYDHLKISFVNAVYDWSKDYSKEYELKGGKLVETRSE